MSAEIAKWEVILGPFDSYSEALKVASPIHAEHEEDYPIAIVGKDAEGTVRKVVI